MKKSWILVLLALAACQSAPPPKGVKIGKPYSVGGTTYYPAYDPTYDEKGLASWYGPGFHGNRTANGEKFDTHDLTAAHPTLPMPSLVRVTNLENGKVLVVRINDRGPFARGRIIDLSKESAKRLGVVGLSKVRVQYLGPESEQYIAAVAEGRRIDMFAYNEQIESDKVSTILAATAPSDQTFIVESTQNETQPGDTVVAAAPIISVAGSDLPAKGEATNGVIVSQAWADEVPRESRGKEVVLRSPNIENDDSAYDREMAEAAPKPAPRPAAKVAADKGYFVQVGSFSQPQNAEKMQRQIAPIARSSIANVEVSGHQWWRLRAGPFSNHAEALTILQKIRAIGAADARVLLQ